ncbi:hypothetical protein [Nocardia anaemiae]|uniref:hypothetical protein n=1 Tax=Nocardia anaemiae TaxID=263910 RepID=UPI0007A48FD7|nr:hypothetical protein [Nocardia anaemiae]
MGTLKADLEILEQLATKLHNLADEAAKVRPKRPIGPHTSPVLVSVTVGEQITTDLLMHTLLPTVKERLGETGDVMANVAREYKNADDNNADQIMNIYRQATGDWNA